MLSVGLMSAARLRRDDPLVPAVAAVVAVVPVSVMEIVVQGSAAIQGDVLPWRMGVASTDRIAQPV